MNGYKRIDGKTHAHISRNPYRAATEFARLYGLRRVYTTVRAGDWSIHFTEPHGLDLNSYSMDYEDETEERRIRMRVRATPRLGRIDLDMVPYLAMGCGLEEARAAAIAGVL